MASLNNISNLDKPFHPKKSKDFKFPKNSQNRAAQEKWFEDFSWLHYDVNLDKVFCFYCSKAIREKKIFGKNHEPAFISSGFNSWKHAMERFRGHEKSDCHKEAVQKMVTLQSEVADVGELLSKEHAVEKSKNRAYLLTILENVRYLARQNIPFRGHDEKNSNFDQLLLLRSSENDKILEWLEKKNKDKFTSHEIQNELIEIMAMVVLRKIIKRIQETDYFAFMSDETTDCSNHEQGAVVLRWIEEKTLKIHEDFVGLYKLESITAESMFKMVEDVLLRANLPFSKLRGQSYDGAANMSGIALKIT